MIAQQQVATIWTVEQYLALERHSTVKHEYHNGYVYAMAGGTQRHSQIAGNVYAQLRAAVRGAGCRALNSDIKVRQSPGDYVYADAVVTCDPRDAAPDQDWIEYPTLIVEVLSPSTEHYDRGDKFEGYKGIRSLREYLLVEQSRRAVRVWRQDMAGVWTSTDYGPGGAIALIAVDLVLALDLLYEDSGI